MKLSDFLNRVDELIAMGESALQTKYDIDGFEYLGKS